MTQITKEDRTLIAKEVIAALQDAEYCSTCKLQAYDHRQDHEDLRSILPTMRKLEKTLDELDQVKWSIFKKLIIVGILFLVGLTGIKIWGG